MHDKGCVSVVIPVWNLWEMTEACLRSLAEHSAGENMQVVVVDNHSTDATATDLAPLGESLFGASFKAVRMPENVGFARGCNAGATPLTCREQSSCARSACGSLDHSSFPLWPCGGN